ncbi:restriction endonuclease subunit S [Pseudomonas sp. DWP3-1-2]|uniref:restriction endonuclease subunit S n=1 Tax=Pseudomonas sp. DWP3-1-2 TaxID=2804645 RepID=UPI003CF9569F
MSFSSYGSYKDTNVAELGEVPAHWNVVPLKHVVETPITDGPHETPEFIDDGIPFVSAEAVSSGEINFSKSRFISHADHHRYSKKYKPRRNDIFMVKSGATTGVVALVSTDRDFNIWSPLAVVRCSRLAFPRYVLQAMRSRNFQESVILNWSFGTQQNIGMSVIENLRIPLPPKPEQTQIARFLDHETARIDALIEEQQRLIELLKEKRQAVISHAVTKGLDPTVPMKDSGVEWLGEVPVHWDVKQLKHVVDSNTSITYGIVQAGPEFEGGIPYIRTSDMNGKELPISGYPLTSPDIDESYARSRVRPGDIVMSIRASVGKCLPVPDELKVANLTQGTAKISAGKDITRNFLIAYLNAETTQNYFDLMAKGATFKEITLDALRRTPVLLPPSDEQIKIDQFVARHAGLLDETSKQAVQTVSLLQERRSALISAAVTGKIDVRGWQPPVSAPSPECEEELV